MQPFHLHTIKPSNMLNRRKFLQLSSLTAPLLAAKDLFAVGAIPRKPIVVSTWESGKDVNREAWLSLIHI